MTIGYLISGLFLLGIVAYFFGKSSIRKAVAQTDLKQHSLDNHHGLYLALFFLFPPLVIIFFLANIRTFSGR